MADFKTYAIKDIIDQIGFVVLLQWSQDGILFDWGETFMQKQIRTGALLVLLMHVEGVTFPYVHGGLRDDSCGLECICLQV